ncbi:MAG TPA: S9 family peptidase, partial [Candidatus Eisenbacteria bacterium]|nr:S9 family peptidase [Candidatus Eisenbacteria bacterium]
RQLTRGTRCKEWAPAWSRDGRWILYCTDRREQPWFGTPAEDNDVRAIAPDLATPTDGDDTAIVADIAGPIAQFVEGPGGRIAAVGGTRPQPPSSYDRSDLLLFEGAWPCTRPRALTAGADLHVGEGISSDQHPPRGGGAPPLGFAADGRIVFVHARHGAGLLAACDPASGRVEALTGPEHEVVAGSLSADGRRVALVLGSLASPGALCVHDLAARTLVSLFDPNAALLADARLGEVEAIRYPSFDGAEIQGWIVKPPDFDPGRRYPLILEIHGGPHTAYGVGFFHEFRVLAAAGYVVLYTNPRGSTGYGQAFANVIQYRFPGDDARDLLAGVDHVVARGYVDERRLGVTGGSGGGLLTNWLITQTPRFAAAITQRCVTDWTGMWYSSDFAMFSPFWFRGAPWEDPADFAARSPGTYVDRIETPLLVLHSEEDWRTPIAQGEILFRALLYRRRPVAMVRFPGENHELSRSGAPSRRVQNQQHIRRWFDHWLQGKPAPEYGLGPPDGSPGPRPGTTGGSR